MLIVDILLYIFSFIIIWIGAGLIVASADHISQKLRLSSFAVSFFILGMLTSIPEFAVGLTSVAQKKPEIFIGNLIGGIAVIFLLLIPILAIIGNGIRLTHELNNRNLLLALGVILAPSLAVGDEILTSTEGIILILLYLILFYVIERERGIFNIKNILLFRIRSYSFFDILEIFTGIALIFIASQIIVDKTLYFAQVTHLSPFFLSLFILSIGTNLPELSLAARSVLSGKKDIAFGDYVGSAAANTLLFGIFTILSVGTPILVNNFFKTFLLLLGGLGLFYYFSRSKNDISRKEGFILLLLYLFFLLFEISFSSIFPH